MVDERIVTGCESCWRGEGGVLEELIIWSIVLNTVVGIPLRIKAMGRRIEEQLEDRFVLREESAPYSADFDPQKRHLSSENSYYWDASLASLIG